MFEISFLCNPLDFNKTRKFFGRPCPWRPKISELINWNSHCDSKFLVNYGKTTNLKRALMHFYFLKMIFLHMAHGLISGIITVNV